MQPSNRTDAPHHAAHTQEASDAAEQAATVREELGELEASRREVDDAHRHALHTSAALEAAVQSSAQDCAAAEADMQRAQREVWGKSVSLPTNISGLSFVGSDGSVLVEVAVVLDQNSYHSQITLTLDLCTQDVSEIQVIGRQGKEAAGRVCKVHIKHSQPHDV